MKTKTNGGQGGSTEQHKKAGKKGGRITLQRKGKEFFSKIGSIGGQISQGTGKGHKLTAEERSRGGKNSRKIKL